MIDRKGNTVEKGDSVIAPNPKEGDTHKKAFVGRVTDIIESRSTAIVEDGCGESFEIYTDRLEKK